MRELGLLAINDLLCYNVSMDFEWDETKARTNLQKHGMRFETACSVFDDPLASIFDDEDLSTAENREVIIGSTAANQLIVVCFVERNNKVRLISARRATATERKEYEENV